jgi:hypothetical protein
MLEQSVEMDFGEQGGDLIFNALVVMLHEG